MEKKTKQLRIECLQGTIIINSAGNLATVITVNKVCHERLREWGYLGFISVIFELAIAIRISKEEATKEKKQ